MKTSHTPERLAFDGTYIHGTDGTRFLAVCADKGKHLGPLFAAAPEMFEVLQTLEDWADKQSQPGERWPALAIRAALAKASGTR